MRKGISLIILIVTITIMLIEQSIGMLLMVINHYNIVKNNKKQSSI